MSILDFIIFGLYMCGVLGIGYYHFRKNKNAEDYYVGSRSIDERHVGLSIVATDVGGGFSIGLGGLGFAMGLAGSWLLFTGLIGAWLSAVFIIPRIKKLDKKHGMYTYPDFLRLRYGKNVALLAALISGIGYMGFTGAQILAGAKLASVTLITHAPFGLTPLQFALYVIAFITIVYTVIGGLKAVIYTDTVQWIILLAGLIFVTIPVAVVRIGGISALKDTLPPEFFDLTNISGVQFINWMVTIIPIWLIGMTLYQRMFACKDEKSAKKAWYIAGIFEYPIMAFTGVFLGMCARVVFPEVESEMGLPMLIKRMLPVGVTGIVIASYFSAIMSTADSCLMASSGNFVNDIIQRYFVNKLTEKRLMRLSQAATLIIGVVAVLIASRFEKVLEAILYAYSFMVAGLFIPTLGAYFWKRSSSAGAFGGMLAGGMVTLLLQMNVIQLPNFLERIGFEACLYGILISLITFISLSLLMPDKEKKKGRKIVNMKYDIVEKMRNSIIQHGKQNDRVYLMKLHQDDMPYIIDDINVLAQKNGYTKIFVKAPENLAEEFKKAGFLQEGLIPHFYNGEVGAAFLSKFLDNTRANDSQQELIAQVLDVSRLKAEKANGNEPANYIRIEKADENDLDDMIAVYKTVFKTYPFPIHDKAYLRKSMHDNLQYYCVRKDNKIVALASSEIDFSGKNAEMTDFATLPEHLGNGYAFALLSVMETAMREQGIITAYTIARAYSYGMNITFAKHGYKYAGTLIKNTNIYGNIESMNLWYKDLRST